MVILNRTLLQGLFSRPESRVSIPFSPVIARVADITGGHGLVATNNISSPTAEVCTPRSIVAYYRAGSRYYRGGHRTR
jgi:hypothetical protein